MCSKCALTKCTLTILCLYAQWDQITHSKKLTEKKGFSGPLMPFETLIPNQELRSIAYNDLYATSKVSFESSDPCCHTTTITDSILPQISLNTVAGEMLLCI